MTHALSLPPTFMPAYTPASATTSPSTTAGAAAAIGSIRRNAIDQRVFRYCSRNRAQGAQHSRVCAIIRGYQASRAAAVQGHPPRERAVIVPPQSIVLRCDLAFAAAPVGPAVRP